MLYKFWNNNYNIGWGTRIWTGNARVRAASFTVKLSPIFLLYYQWLKIFYFSVYYLCVFFYLIIPSTYYKAQNGVKLFLKKFKPNYLVINFPHISINTVFNPTDLNFPIKCLAPYNWSGFVIKTSLVVRLPTTLTALPKPQREPVNRPPKVLAVAQELSKQSENPTIRWITSWLRSAVCKFKHPRIPTQYGAVSGWTLGPPFFLPEFIVSL